MNKPTVTASTVREFFRNNEKRFASLSEAAQTTVAEGARGRLHPEVIKSFNKGRKNRYELGATSAVAQAKRAQRAELVEKGLAGKRGPLRKEVLAQVKA